MKTVLKLSNMKFYAYHGVLPYERVAGGYFEVNLTIEADLSKATESDDLSDTLNYSDIYDLVKMEMQQPSQLIERVAGRIFNAIKDKYRVIDALEVRVAKLNPPVEGEAEKAEIIIRD